MLVSFMWQKAMLKTAKLRTNRTYTPSNTPSQAPSHAPTYSSNSPYQSLAAASNAFGNIAHLGSIPTEAPSNVPTGSPSTAPTPTPTAPARVFTRPNILTHSHSTANNTPAPTPWCNQHAHSSLCAFASNPNFALLKHHSISPLNSTAKTMACPVVAPEIKGTGKLINCRLPWSTLLN